MKKTPKTVEELPTFEEDCKAIYKFLNKHWDGIQQVQPIGFFDFLQGSEEFKGMDDLKPDEDFFEGFDDSTVGSFSFPTKVSLPHVAYEDSVRTAAEVLIAAIMGYGHARGFLYGIQEGKKQLSVDLLDIAMKNIYS